MVFLAAVCSVVVKLSFAVAPISCVGFVFGRKTASIVFMLSCWCLSILSFP